MDVVGAIASATQLIHYAVKLTTILATIDQRMRDVSKRINLQHGQLSQLIDTAQLIKNNQLLQTPTICAHVNATLEEARDLSKVLERVDTARTNGLIRKCWIALDGRKEREVLASLDRLEKQKTALVLCVITAHSNVLCDIHNGVKTLNNTLSGPLAEAHAMSQEDSYYDQNLTGGITDDVSIL